MACLLFVYSRTSIRAAKQNAQRHREADGGQISWHNESLRRHGQLEKPPEQGALKTLVGQARDKVQIPVESKGRESREEAQLRKAKKDMIEGRKEPK
jgi:hypothetical protein